MDEDLVLFGQSQSMVGILTTGDPGQPCSVGCLLPNIGLAHRIGPHRLTVKVARALSELGVASMRFDLSGIGDSPTTNSADLIQQAVNDMRSAMDCMHQRMGITKFVVFGICSGAQNGYFLSLQDDRIVGLMMFDGFEFPSLSSRLMHHLYRLKVMPWRALLAEVRHRLDGSGGPKASPDIFLAALMEMHPTRAQFAAALEKLVARGVSICAVFSGSRRAFDFRRGLYGGFGYADFMRQVTYRFEGGLDHTATSLASQQTLLGMIREWAETVVTPQGQARLAPPAETTPSARAAGVRVARPRQHQAAPDR